MIAGRVLTGRDAEAIDRQTIAGGRPLSGADGESWSRPGSGYGKEI
ncbi:hypothetical protein [Candidatus Hakubella thermalkaliphila]|nr:hypothetical protein [Candidatus Hakubella thermalkaliphila]